MEFDDLELDFDLPALKEKVRDDQRYDDIEMNDDCHGKAKSDESFLDYNTVDSGVNHLGHEFRELYGEGESVAGRHSEQRFEDDRSYFFGDESEEEFDIDEYMYVVDESTAQESQYANEAEDVPHDLAGCPPPFFPDEEEKIQTGGAGGEKKRPRTGMWNNFIVRRSCFRAFTKYYRKQFADRNKKFQKKRALKKKRLDMMDLVREFCQEEFPALLERMN